MSEAPSLSVDIVSKGFRTADGGALQAIDGIHFEAAGSEFVCLVGPSGCGKTTTLRIVLGLDEEYDGHVMRPPGRMAAVFQEPRLLPWRTVRDNIELALSGGEGASVASLLADLDLDGMEGDHRHVVQTGGPSRAPRAGSRWRRQRAAILAGDDQTWSSRRPPVGGGPVGGAVAPPGVDLLRLRDRLAHQVDPAAGLAHRLEISVSTGVWLTTFSKLLVRPDVVFQRRDVEIADQDRCGSVGAAGRHRRASPRQNRACA
jgi:ABC-type sugar transport system ATPase subunit